MAKLKLNPMGEAQAQTSSESQNTTDKARSIPASVTPNAEDRAAQAQAYNNIELLPQSAPGCRMASSKGGTMQHVHVRMDETQTESESRQKAGFVDVESRLMKRWSWQDMLQKTKITGFLGSQNPFARRASPKENIVWVLDNTAYRPIHPYATETQPWQAEFVACYFKKGRKDISKFVSNIADEIGLDGQAGPADAETRKTIEDRVEPFIHAIASSRSVEISMPTGFEGQPDHSHTLTLGPSDQNGISSEIHIIGKHEGLDGKTITTKSTRETFPKLSSRTRFVGPEGWGIISDIDDTIKITQTVNPVGILKTTFADKPVPISGMPGFYKILNEQFKSPAWFYLSASPYNLYHFLHDFIEATYTPGTIILRDSSWMYLGGLLQSLTQAVQPYKVSRMDKIHSWLPKRKMICIGDSTQSDPESYAEIYKKYPGWICAIYIRKVVDVPHMEEKNKEERFVKAFEGVDKHVWKVFVQPDELAEHVKHLAGEAHFGMVGALQGYFCKQEKAVQKAFKTVSQAVSPGSELRNPLELN